jgi:hypothetical protein
MDAAGWEMLRQLKIYLAGGSYHPRNLVMAGFLQALLAAEF